jgi:hypothetical protein
VFKFDSKMSLGMDRSHLTFSGYLCNLLGNEHANINNLRSTRSLHPITLVPYQKNSDAFIEDDLQLSGITCMGLNSIWHERD